jgi:type IV pilus assembly protein PilF
LTEAPGEPSLGPEPLAAGVLFWDALISSTVMYLRVPRWISADPRQAIPIDRPTLGPVNDPAVPSDSPHGSTGVFACLPTRLPATCLPVLVLLLGAGLLSSCGGAAVGPDDAERSMKQYELAIGLQGEGNPPGAFQALFRAIELDPNNSKAHLVLASLFLLQRDDNPKGHDQKAEHHFREVLRVQASDQRMDEQSLVPDAYNGLGVLYIHQGKYREAIAELEQAVADLFNRSAYMAWGNIGWAYTELENYPKAIDALIRAVRLHPKFCVGYYRLGLAYLKTKAFDKAEQSLGRALDVDERCKTFQDAWHLRGQARMNLGLRDDARGDFERCVELDATNEAGKSCSRFLEATY